MLHAMLITPATIDGIKEINNGVRPLDETMEKQHFFVYSCDPNNDIVPEIHDAPRFYRTYRFRDTWNNDNTIEKI